MPQLKQSLCAVALLASAGVGCSAIKSFEQVEKATTEVGQKMDETNDGIDNTNGKMEEMKREMGSMNDKLIETNQRMENMNRALDRMYQDLRQGDALAARLQTVEKMSEAKTLKGKTVYAAQYFMSFEYQLWKGEGSDVLALREILKRDAVDEFVQTLRRFAGTRLSVDVLSTDRDLLSLEALSLTSHMLNSNAGLVADRKKFAIESMHSLLRESLAYGYKLSTGAVALREVPEFAQYALREPELVKYVFELRINMLPVLIVSEVSQVASDQFLNRWLSRAQVWMKPWEADLSRKNEVELHEFIEWLSWAEADLNFLKSIGLQPRMNASMLKTLRNIRFVDRSSNVSSKRTAATSELKNALGRFLDQAE